MVPKFVKTERLRAANLKILHKIDLGGWWTAFFFVWKPPEGEVVVERWTVLGMGFDGKCENVWETFSDRLDFAINSLS